LERDWKKLIAYSSVSHMGYCLLGMAVATPAGINGTLMAMWNHGIITGALFLLVGVIYDRAHHRDIGDFGGLWAKMPYYGGITALMFMASLGLPGLAGFIGEVLCFMGAFQAVDPSQTYLGISGLYFYRLVTSISVLGVVFGAGYFLWSYQKIFLGPLNPKYSGMNDLTFRELFMLIPLVGLTIILGIIPSAILNLQNKSVDTLVNLINMPWIK